MTILHESSTYNVEATITRYFTDELAALTKPALLPSYTVIVLAPETPITTTNTPAFSMVHIPAGDRSLWQGSRADNVKGRKALAIFEISAWTTRSQRNWNAQLSLMESMVQQVNIQANNGIRIRDYQSSPSNPTEVPYIVRTDDMEVVATVQDPNPDLQRRRMLISYSWVVRAN